MTIREELQKLLGAPPIKVTLEGGGIPAVNKLEFEYVVVISRDLLQRTLDLLQELNPIEYQ